DDCGRRAPTGTRYLVEFVSANPTGPITVASGRHAAWGDALCRILEAAGHDVEREFYVNDQGTQVLKFGESIAARARGEEPPVDEHEVALWLRRSELGDDEDRVLRRSDGEWTYFGADIAYHLDTRQPGYARLIDHWGADHHGYVARMHAAWRALGGDPDALEI